MDKEYKHFFTYIMDNITKDNITKDNDITTYARQIINQSTWNEDYSEYINNWTPERTVSLNFGVKY